MARGKGGSTPARARTGRAGKRDVATGDAPAPTPTEAQRRWLVRGLSQPGGKLPLFDDEGQRIDAALVRICLKAGWAAPWFDNPLKPDWQVCRLTDAGRSALESGGPILSDVPLVLPLQS